MTTPTITSFTKNYPRKEFVLSVQGANSYSFSFSPSTLNSKFEDNINNNRYSIMVGDKTFSIDELLKIAQRNYPNFQLPL